MILKEITIGQSCQVIRMGQPECWNKISVTATIDEAFAESMEDATKHLMARIESLHKQLAPDAVEMFFNEPKRSVIDRIKNS